MNNTSKKKKRSACGRFFGKLGYAIGMIVIFPVSIIASCRKMYEITVYDTDIGATTSDFYLKYRKRDSVFSNRPKITNEQRTKRLLEHYKITDEVYLAIAGHYVFTQERLLLYGMFFAFPKMALFYCLFSELLLMQRVEPNKTNFLILLSQILPRSFQKRFVPYVYAPPFRKLLEEQYQQDLNTRLSKASKEFIEQVERENDQVFRKLTQELVRPDIFDLYYQNKKLALESSYFFKKRALLEEQLNGFNISAGPKTLIHQYYMSSEDNDRYDFFKAYERVCYEENLDAFEDNLNLRVYGHS